MQRPFVVIRTRTAAWDDSQPLEAQKGWAAHAAFMDSLAAEGFVVLAGPLEETRDVVLVIQAVDCAEIVDRLAADPWTQDGLLIVKECRPWHLRLGSLVSSVQRGRRAD